MGYRLHIAKKHEVIWDTNGYFNNRNQEVYDFISRFEEDTQSIVDYTGESLELADTISIEAIPFNEWLSTQDNPMARKFKEMTSKVHPNSDGFYNFCWW